MGHPVLYMQLNRIRMLENDVSRACGKDIEIMDCSLCHCLAFASSRSYHTHV